MKISIHIPTDWNDCTDDQLFKIHQLIASGLDGIRFDATVFKILARGKWYRFLHKCKLILIYANVPASELRTFCPFIYEKNTLTRFPNLKTKNPQLLKRMPPMESLTNMTVGEFAIADDLHIKWRVHKDPEYLQALAACLYATATHPRPEFDKNNIVYDMEPFKHLPVEQLLVIDQAFHGTKEAMADMYKYVFPKPKKTPTNQAPTKPRSSSEFPELINQFAGQKFGNYDQTQRTNVYTFLTELDSYIRNLKKQK